MSVSSLRAPLLVAALAVAASACAPLRSHQGYVIDADLVNSIQPGVDNRESVLQTLGNPTLSGQFSDRTWYYVARDTKYLAFNTPEPTRQVTLRVTFDDAGNVTAIDRTGEELIASIDPSNRKTPTLGRESGFFEDLFGNIGTVGAPGTGGPSGP
ncbi:MULTISPECIES: outer membrane protein assembly factor BamE [unclassified Sphingosinithalassobacter]|uniref:outer membrane protein assembly factor BamE n=1 Tax=unclassified Sphingosinithalassobacter TaxID=2676235 RepID=UPI00165E747C|nr:outer membrane protein assembly factor BamE [Sphingosinithalassobacter sp. CS137]